MKLVKLHSGDDRVKEINKIYLEAFPPQERFEIEIMMSLADKGIFDVCAVISDGVTAGMLVLFNGDNTVYVCFFAIEKSLRGKGLGSEVIKRVCSLYPEKQTVLEIEALDSTAENFAQRKRRESFYLAAGFRHTNRYIRYGGVTYEVMFTGRPEFDKSGFDRIMDSRRSKEFTPVLFDTKPYSTYIFDLDGTLLDTLTDLTNSANYAVESVGCPPHTKQEICSFVGNGIRKLIERALPEGAPVEDIDKAFENFKAHYKQHCCDFTEPYDGIMPMLQQLRAHGKKIAVVSNKADFATKELCKAKFGDLIDFCAGEQEGSRRKPAPDTVLRAMQSLGSKPEECVYIGDSDVDIRTAENTGIDCISVLWGFRKEKFLLEKGAKVFAQTPNEICLLTEIT